MGLVTQGYLASGCIELYSRPFFEMRHDIIQGFCALIKDDTVADEPVDG